MQTRAVCSAQIIPPAKATCPTLFTTGLHSWMTPRSTNRRRSLPSTESIPGHAPCFPSASKIVAEGIFLCPKTWICRRAVIPCPIECGTTVTTFSMMPHTFETEAIFGPSQAERIRPRCLGAGAFLIRFVKSLEPRTFRSLKSPILEPVYDQRRRSSQGLDQSGRNGAHTVGSTRELRCLIWLR